MPNLDIELAQMADEESICRKPNPPIDGRRPHRKNTDPSVTEWRKSDGKREHVEDVRPFVAWDGEGITYEEGTAQSYVLFGNSTGQRVYGTDLGTVHCLETLLYSARINPGAINVGFALGYDFNMILKDLPKPVLWDLYTTNKVRWQGYKIERIPGKWLYVRKIKGKDKGVKLFDVFGYFQSSFVKACEEYLGKDNPELVRIREGKAARSSFAFDELHTMIVPYWEAELRLLVRLMDALRDDFTSADIKVRSWHGPGAVANAVFLQHNIKEAKGEAPTQVAEAARYAYAGGRFELFRCGHHSDTVWEYDLNSAYPSVIAELPDLSNGTWQEVREFEPESFGVWRVSYDDRRSMLQTSFDPQPLFCRDVHGGVSFPAIVSGWYWTPEASKVVDCVQGGWVYRHNGAKPFEFVRSMYETRQQWKTEGNSAQRALKLALNSLYGKTAQRSGWVEGRDIPKWHQLEWAGYVTSAVRATLWDAISQNPAAIIAVETDAVFTSEPLDLITGKALGQWEVTKFDWITYIQSGLYYGSVNGEPIEKYRGFDKGSLPHDTMVSYLSSLDNAFESHRVPPPMGLTTRFVGMGLGLRTSAVWRAWETAPRTVRLGGGGKRLHYSPLCESCRSGLPFVGNLHPLMIGSVGGESFPHSLPWLEGDPSQFRLMEAIQND